MLSQFMCDSHLFHAEFNLFFLWDFGVKKIEAWFEKLLFLKPFFSPKKTTPKLSKVKVSTAIPKLKTDAVAATRKELILSLQFPLKFG